MTFDSFLLVFSFLDDDVYILNFKLMMRIFRFFSFVFQTDFIFFGISFDEIIKCILAQTISFPNFSVLEFVGFPFLDYLFSQIFNFFRWKKLMYILPTIHILYHDNSIYK